MGGLGIAAGLGGLVGSWFGNGFGGFGGNRVAEAATIAAVDGGCGCGAYERGKVEGQLLTGVDFTAQSVGATRNEMQNGFANVSAATCMQTRDILSAITQSEVNTLNRELNKANSQIVAAETQAFILNSQRQTDDRLCALGTQNAIIGQNVNCLATTVNSLISPAEVRCHRHHCCGGTPTVG